ncbi:hypothetical protein CSB20_07850 [bacterium DOLZORAL124_64_63]|nr:MAG: hypothetical protein CSB20_07850 [bacterium DOLZORAL124_64_63]
MPARWGRPAFLLAVFTLPWAGVGVVHALTGVDMGGGLQPSWLLLAGALLAGVGTWRKVLGQGPGGRLLFCLTGLPLAAMLLSLIGLWEAPSGEPLNPAFGRWLRQVVQWLIMMAFVWGTVLYWRRGGSLRPVLDFLFAGVVFQILYSGWMAWNFQHPGTVFAALEGFFTSNPSILAGSERLYVDNQLQNFPRLRGTVCEPLYLGNYLVTVWPLLFIWRRPLAWRLILGGLMALLLAMTFSRGAWLGLSAQLPVLGVGWYLSERRTTQTRRPCSCWRVWAVPLSLVALAMAGDLATGGYLRLRLLAAFNAQDWSNLTRLYSMQAAWRAFQLSPWVGVGWGQYPFHFPLLVDPMGLQSQFTWPVVNNYPLKILCETGLAGLLTFLGLGVHLVRRVLFTPRGRGVPRNAVVGAALLGLWGAGVQLCTFSQYNLPHLWFVLGVLVAGLENGPSADEDTA